MKGFLSCRYFLILTTSSAGLVGCRSFFCRLTWAVDRWRSTRSAKDVVRMTKDLQERTQLQHMNGTTVKP